MLPLWSSYLVRVYIWRLILNQDGVLVAEGKADIFLTYCTGALEAQKQNAGQQIVRIVDELAVGADYGLTVLTRASPQAYQFAMFILSVDGQRVLARHGFAAPLLPP